MHIIFFYIWNINEVIRKEENKVPEILFEASKVAGSATYRQSKMELLCPLKVRLFIHENKENLFIYLVLGKTNQSMKICFIFSD